MSVTLIFLPQHYKGTLVGHSDSNQSEDVAIRVTYAYNYFQVRFLLFGVA